jgi:hypothetical protein
MPRTAHAEDAQPPRVTYPAHLTLELGIEGLGLGASNRLWAPFEGGFGGLSAGLLFGVGPRWSVGLSGAAEVGPSSDYNVVGRVDAEARYHPILGRWGDAWVSGLAGMGVFGDSPGFTLGPHVGVGAGADVHPFTFLSLGIHVRTGLYGVLNVTPNWRGAGAWAEASGAIVLGFHVPNERPAQGTETTAEGSGARTERLCDDREPVPPQVSPLTRRPPERRGGLREDACP